MEVWERHGNIGIWERKLQQFWRSKIIHSSPYISHISCMIIWFQLENTKIYQRCELDMACTLDHGHLWIMMYLCSNSFPMLNRFDPWKSQWSLKQLSVTGFAALNSSILYLSRHTSYFIRQILKSSYHKSKNTTLYSYWKPIFLALQALSDISVSVAVLMRRWDGRIVERYISNKP